MKKLQAFKQRQGHDIGGVRPVMIPDDAGEWVSRHDAEHQIEHISAQRDALLTALEKAFEMRVTCHPEWEAIARTAIASAKGGAA
ncbi:Uncharacterised protein [Klebsiella pneumoniae]|nr:Uncharacterised protein [Klebsiella pneumoniae]